MSHVKSRIVMLPTQNDHVEAPHNMKKYIVKYIFAISFAVIQFMWPHASYKTWIYIPDFKMVWLFAQSIFQNGSFDERLATSRSLLMLGIFHCHAHN